MRYLLAISSFVVVLFISSCVEEMEFEMKKTQEQVVVKCLFNPEENWSLCLSRTRRIVETVDAFVEHAKVVIYSEKGEEIKLTYQGEGIYTSDTKPKPEEVYKLKINIPNHKEITAEAIIPALVKASVNNVDVNWITYMNPSELLDYDVFPLTINFEKKVEQARFVFRATRYYKGDRKSRYMFTSSALEKLKQRGLPQKAYGELIRLVDRWEDCDYVFTECLESIKDQKVYYEFFNMIKEEVTEEVLIVPDTQDLDYNQIFADDNWLGNVSFDTYRVIGEGNNIAKAAILYSDINLKSAIANDNDRNCEYSVEVTRGDSNYLQYYKTYMLQVSQRINPYSDPVEVYSNIENGTGIFAGYNRQMVHILDH
ncbi:DUF4249 family protein [Puteibacter caeruleilacunae]|nr:DUF4249 family protein [Puteibacter caeruleilacunae]